MSAQRNQIPISLGIAAVECDTGLSKDTLRVWERRYGFPLPSRDAFGERAYSAEQVDKLRVVRRLMDAGHRPGRIVGLPMVQLNRLSAELSVSPNGNASDEYMGYIKGHRVEQLRRALSQTLLRVGLERFVVETVAPLNAAVGVAWSQGQLEVFEEHIYSESVQVIMRNAISSIPQAGRVPRVLLTTFPRESHGLGLLMVEALLALEGADCLSLGVQTPINDIVAAALSQQANILALSFSASLNPNHVVDGLIELRAKLPSQIEIWAGGANSALQRRPQDGIRVTTQLQAIHQELLRWRNAHH